jgi:hypothetical protein
MTVSNESLYEEQWPSRWIVSRVPYISPKTVRQPLLPAWWELTTAEERRERTERDIRTIVARCLEESA